MEFEETSKEIIARVNENNTSLHITLPPYLKGLYGLKKGDFICVVFKGVIKREK